MWLILLWMNQDGWHISLDFFFVCHLFLIWLFFFLQIVYLMMVGEWIDWNVLTTKTEQLLEWILLIKKNDEKWPDFLKQLQKNLVNLKDVLLLFFI